MPGSSRAVTLRRFVAADQVEKRDLVAVEEPLEIQLAAQSATGSAAKSVSITMRTPGDDVELALGFLYTEGIIKNARAIAAATPVGPVAEGDLRQNTIRIELEPQVEVDLGRLQRHFYTTSSCGVCGKSSLEALRIAGLAPLVDSDCKFSHDVITAMPDRLKAKQRLFSETGGLHAAAAFDESGDIVVLREDVGRHNAVDKVVGYLLQKDRLPASRYGLLVSGRASFELLQKALVAGMPLLAAVGAPSSLAVELANDFHITLIGFLRELNFNVYSAAERVE